MFKYDRPSGGEISPSVQLFRFCLVMLGGFFIANLLGGVAGLFLFGLDQEAIQALLNEPEVLDNAPVKLLIMQGFISVALFVLTPLFYLYFVEREPLTYAWKTTYDTEHLFRLGVLIFFITWFVMPLNSVIIEWNRGVDFPSFLEGFEQWAQQREALAEKLTTTMTQLSSWPALLLGILVIGVVPAVGEELVFRYIIQRKLHLMTGNIHVAIIVAGFVFSLFHMQFYGFVPRMLLGALFGYLFYWSGTIWAPVFAHFVNNAGTVVMMYLYQHNIIGYNLEKTESARPLPVLIFTVFTLVLLGVFHRLAGQEKQKGV